VCCPQGFPADARVPATGHLPIDLPDHPRQAHRGKTPWSPTWMNSRIPARRSNCCHFCTINLQIVTYF